MAALHMRGLLDRLELLLEVDEVFRLLSLVAIGDLQLPLRKVKVF